MKTVWKGVIGIALIAAVGAGTAIGTATAMKIPIISPKTISFNKAIS